MFNWSLVYWIGAAWCLLYVVYALLIVYVITPRYVKNYGSSSVKGKKWLRRSNWIVRSRIIYTLSGTFLLFLVMLGSKYI
jgi:hypothetical protein